ncbi:MAP kinase Spk1, partial [Asimina triloba]
ARVSSDLRGIFSLDAPSASVCLLIQLEKPVTEEGGVTPSAYSRKEPVHLSEREKQKLQVWSRIMPYRESFAWAIVPLFENGSTAAGGAASPSSPLAPSVSGSSSQESVVDALSKHSLDGKLAQCSSGNSIVVEISNLNKVKESYTEEYLQDPKRKVHKPVKGVLKLEIEKLQAVHPDMDNISESGSITNDSIDAGDRFPDAAFTKCPSNGSDGRQNGNPKWNAAEGKETRRNGPNLMLGNYPDYHEAFHAFDFRIMTRSEPFSQLFHCLYFYPLTVSLSRKRNLFIRVELRKDDADIRKHPIE